MFSAEFAHGDIKKQILTEPLPQGRHLSACWSCIAVSTTQNCPLRGYMPVTEADNKNKKWVNDMLDVGKCYGV